MLAKTRSVILKEFSTPMFHQFGNNYGEGGSIRPHLQTTHTHTKKTHTGTIFVYTETLRELKRCSKHARPLDDRRSCLQHNGLEAKVEGADHQAFISKTSSLIVEMVQ